MLYFGNVPKVNKSYRYLHNLLGGAKWVTWDGRYSFTFNGDFHEKHENISALQEGTIYKDGGGFIVEGGYFMENEYKLVYSKYNQEWYIIDPTNTVLCSFDGKLEE